MNRILRNILLLTTILVLAACNLNSPSGTPAVAAFSALGLAIQAQNGSAPLNAVGQAINYSYTVTNTGTMALAGSVTVNSDKAPGMCPGLDSTGNLNTTFDPNEVIVCTGSYTITQADLAAGSVTNNAIASINGTNSSQMNAVVTLAAVNAPPVTSTPQATPTPSYVPGSTIQHRVEKGEWLLQIARCYGADYTATRRANPRIIFPDLIKPNTLVTVPNVGSKGAIYGPPCVKFHTVQAGETWASIAQLYNADVVVLQAANRGVVLSAGQVVKVPVNSAGGATPPTPGLSMTTTTSLNALPTTLTSGQSVSFSGQVSANPAAPNGQAVKLQAQNGGCGSNAFTDLFQVVTTSGNGSFSGSFTVPAVAGTYGVRASFSGATSGGNTWQPSSSTCQTVAVTVPASSAKAITSFGFANPAVSGVINEAAHTIAVTVPSGTNVTALVPTISHTGASINPASGVAQNFTGPVTYTVTAADASTQAYTVTVTVNPAQSGSKIAFETNRNGTTEIYVMDPTGNNLVNLSKNMGFDGSPAWSPDGTKLAFVTDRNIYVMSAIDGSNRTQLTHADSSTEYYSPVWSPDGSKIAFGSQDLNTGNFEIYVMSADGSNQTNLTQNPAEDTDPDWSPDGTKIMFASGRDGNDLEIFVMDAGNGSILAQLTMNSENDSQAKWSPDGSKIVFVHAHNSIDDILVMDATGQNQINLTNGSALVNDSPTWSPDGTRIAFYSARPGPLESDGDAEIYVMDIQGNNLVNLTSNTSITDSSPAWWP